MQILFLGEHSKEVCLAASRKVLLHQNNMIRTKVNLTFKKLVSSCRVGCVAMPVEDVVWPHMESAVKHNGHKFCKPLIPYEAV